jgi:extradiol dioxygenase family protein
MSKLPEAFDTITLLQENKQDWCFQLGGATARTTKTAVAFLQDFLGHCIVERGLWPP